MEHIIDPVTKSWNEDLLKAYIHPDDVDIIRGLAISRIGRQDSYGWSFIESGKYTVKSGYRTELLFPDKA